MSEPAASITHEGESGSPESGLVLIPGLIAGRRWAALPASAQLARQVGDQLDDLRNLPGCTIIKENMVRTVYRLRLDGFPDLIVKHYRSRGLRDALKHLFRPTKAEAEWRAARRMAQAGISVPRMLALAVKRSGPLFQDAALVMEAIRDGRSPLDWVHRDPSARRQMLELIASLCARMHRNGIVHPDFHPGNVLATETGANVPELHVLDLHSVRFPFHIGMRTRVQSLAMVVEALQHALEHGELRHLCEHYAGSAGLDARSAGKLWDRVLCAARRSGTSRMSRRTVRCLKTSSGFVRERSGSRRIFRARAFPAARVTAAIDEHRTSMSAASANVIHRASKTAVSVTEDGLCVKEWLPRALCRSWPRTLVGASPGRTAWIAANGLIARGIAVPDPFALVEDLALRGSCYLITRYEGNARPVNDLAREAAAGNVAESEQKAMAAAIGGLVGRLHAQGVCHHDTTTKNFIAERTPQGWDVKLVDLDSVRFWRKLTAERRLEALSRLNDLPDGISHRVKLAFLKAYGRHCPRQIDARAAATIAAMTLQRSSARGFRPPE